MAAEEDVTLMTIALLAYAVVLLVAVYVLRNRIDEVIIPVTLAAFVGLVLAVVYSGIRIITLGFIVGGNLLCQLLLSWVSRKRQRNHGQHRLPKRL